MVFLLRFILPILFLTAPILPAHAAGESLIYGNISTDIRIRETLGFLQNSGVLPQGVAPSIARVDLNGDGIDEMIFRQMTEGCEASSDCLFLLTGVSRKQPVLLATFRARKIGISGEKSYGVKKVLVYNQKRNDFQYITHAWNPFTSSFDPQ